MNKVLFSIFIPNYSLSEKYLTQIICTVKLNVDEFWAVEHSGSFTVTFGNR